MKIRNIGEVETSTNDCYLKEKMKLNEIHESLCRVNS
jgi:hypothetical protein